MEQLLAGLAGLMMGLATVSPHATDMLAPVIENQLNKFADLNQTIVDDTQVYDVWATAYSSTVDQTDDTPFITAANTHVRDGIIAANFLPLGARVQLPEIYGEKIFVVEDRMNGRFRDHVDIWMPSRDAALAFGKTATRIVVLD